MGTPLSPHPLGPDDVSTLDECLAFLQGLDDDMVAYLRQEDYRFAKHPAYADEASVRSAMVGANKSLRWHNRRLARVPDWIKEGLLTREEALRLTPIELKDVEELIDARSGLHLRRELTQKIAALGVMRRVEIEQPPMTMAALAPVLTELVVVLAAQQAEIAELREQLAAQRNASVAVFGKNAIIGQLDEMTSKGFTVRNAEFTLDLHEERLEDEKHAKTAESTETTQHSRSTDTSAKIGGIAKYIASLQGTHKSNLADMNQAVVRLTEATRRRMESRSKGRVTVKFGELVPPHPKKDPER